MTKLCFEFNKKYMKHQIKNRKGSLQKYKNRLLYTRTIVRK